MEITKILLPLTFALCTTSTFANDQKMADSLQITAQSQTAKSAYALGETGLTAILIEQLKEAKRTNILLEDIMQQLKSQKNSIEISNAYLKRILDATQP